jgi:hypothetical protein
MVQIERIALLKVKISFCVSFILSVYSENTRKVFKRLWRKWQIGVICGTQNHLRIRGKYLNVFGEYAEIIFAYMEKMILSIYIIWDGLSQQTISRYCPFKQVRDFLLAVRTSRTKTFSACVQRYQGQGFSASCHG